MRRTWIKLFCDPWLRGSIRKESIEVRAIFTDLLAMAGDSAFGDTGIIQLADGVGFSDGTLAGILNIALKTWLSVKKRLSAHPNPEENRIEIIPLSQGFAIHILKWKTYQSEYNRQRKYREGSKEEDKKEGEKVTEQVTEQVTEEVTDKVTKKVTDRLEGERERDIEEDKKGGKNKRESLREREGELKISPNLPFKIRDKIIVIQAEIKTQKRHLKEGKTNIPEEIAIANIREMEKNIQDLLDASNL